MMFNTLFVASAAEELLAQCSKIIALLVAFAAIHQMLLSVFEATATEKALYNKRINSNKQINSNTWF